MEDKNNRAIGQKLFLKNLVSQYGLQVAKYIIPFITIPYLARVLGTEGFGVRAYVLSAMTIVQGILDFGFGLSATKDIAENREDISIVNRVIGGVIQAKIILTLLVAVGLAIICPMIPILADNLVYVAIAFVSVVLTSFLPDFVFMGYEKMQIMTTRYIVSKALATALIFLLIKTPSDLLMVPIIDVVSSLVSFVWTWISMYRSFHVGLSFVSLLQSCRELKKSAIYFISNFSSTLFNSFTTLAIGFFLTDSTEVAIWSLAMTVISAVQSLYSPIVSSIYPYMIVRKDLKLFKTILKVATPCVLAICVIICFGSKPIMNILGGSEFVNGAYVVMLLSPVLVISFYSLMFGWPLLGPCGYEKQVTVTTIASGVFSVVAVTALGLFGFCNLATMAVARCLTEAVLCFSRGGVAAMNRKAIEAFYQPN